MAASGNEAMTIKQLKDYADSNQLKTGTMQEFCEYMEIPYVPSFIVSDGVQITDNRSKVDGGSIHIEVDVVVDAGTSGTLFTIPTSIAPKITLSTSPNWENADGGVGRYDATIRTRRGDVYLNEAISADTNVKGTITFDYTI